MKGKDEISPAPKAMVLTVREAAHELSSSEAYVRRLIDAGELPAMRMGDGPKSPYRVPRKGLEDYVTRRLGLQSFSPAQAPRKSQPRGGSSGDWAYTYVTLS